VEDDGFRRAAAHEDGGKLLLRHGTPRIHGRRLGHKTNLKGTPIGGGMEVAPSRAKRRLPSVQRMQPYKT
jgi:hypothetical protein